jgi:putative inorganic carbon (hco3(-)) transporter
VTTDRLRQIAWALTLMAIALSGFAVYNYLTGAFALGGASDRVMGNEGSLTKNPNDMALMINLVIPLTIGLFLSSKDLLFRGILLAAIACEAATVVLTYSRAGALTLGVIFSLYFWKLRRRPERRLLYAVLMAAVLALPLLPSTYFDRLSTITSIESDQTGSSQERWTDMTIALQTFLSNPLKGSGLGMNVLTMNQARGDWRAVHNVYLEHALDLGVPGLILFVLLMTACLQAAVLAQRRSQAAGQPRLFHMAEAIQVSLIAYGVAAMFHPVSYQFYFYYIASLAVAARQLSQTQETARA